MTLNEGFSSCYDDLRAVAEQYLARRVGPDIPESTELIGEAYRKLAHRAPRSFRDRAHFLQVVRRAFRGQVSEYWYCVRPRRVSLEVCVDEPSHPHMLALATAFESLERLHPRAAQVVDLHLVGGLGVRETALELGVSERTVVRDTRLARTFLRREMIRHLDLPGRLPT